MEYPFLHRATDIEEEEWERMRKYLIGTLGVGPRYVRELNQKHRHELAHHLDVKVTPSRGWLSSSSSLGIRSFCSVRNVSFHLSLRSYLVRGEVTSLRAGRGVDLEWATETPVLGASESISSGRGLRRASGRSGDWKRLSRRWTAL
ncbi:uncharacterized protein A4U43_C07F22150 [Asparagus officinalis]|uniref:Uncharacterized protein n=1 Tax=Asparagus officinalis TaxID=4686 RepID=A0A5P1EFW8_ASPOF|nr:uncharacterized protein A4U43_C07F22150 [Asparagus officinalis]